MKKVTGIIGNWNGEDVLFEIRHLRNRNLMANNFQYCRDISVEFSVSVDGSPPSRQQYFRMCRTEQGWKSIN